MQASHYLWILSYDSSIEFWLRNYQTKTKLTSDETGL